MDYAAMQSILGWAAIAAALAAGGIVAAMLVYDLGRPLWQRLARLWRRSPVECVAVVALLCYCVAWGGGKITFPRTNAEYELLKDAGSSVTNDAVEVVYARHAILPDEADIQLWRRPASSTNDADWAEAFASTVSAWPSPQTWACEAATNWNWMVFTAWQPAPAVQTNGVLHVDWVRAFDPAAASPHELAAVPLKSTVAVDGAEAWPNADFDATPVTASSYVQDGLVAMWDGIENAGWGVHDPNATNWKNLVGGVADMEFNSLFTDYTFWTDNAIVLKDNNVTELYYCRAHSPTTFKLTSDITIEGYAMVPTNNVWYVRQLMGVSFWHYIGGMNLFARGDGWYSMAFAPKYVYYFDIAGSGKINRANKGLKGSNVMVFCRDSTNFVGYINGSYVAAVSALPTSTLKEAELTAALDSHDYYPALVEVQNYGPQCQDFVIHAFRIYNRALTAEEIKHNYEIDRRRFGSGDE